MLSPFQKLEKKFISFPKIKGNQLFFGENDWSKLRFSCTVVTKLPRRSKCSNIIGEYHKGYFNPLKLKLKRRDASFSISILMGWNTPYDRKPRFCTMKWIDITNLWGLRTINKGESETFIWTTRMHSSLYTLVEYSI